MRSLLFSAERLHRLLARLVWLILSAQLDWLILTPELFFFF